jgi:hypothetical protein
VMVQQLLVLITVQFITVCYYFCTDVPRAPLQVSQR